MHSTADDYETALQFITADTMVMHDARKAMLAASSHTPAGSNAAALIAASLKDLDAVLGQSPIAKQESTQAPARRCLEDRSHLKD